MNMTSSISSGRGGRTRDSWNIVPAPPSAPPSATASASAAIEDNNSEANSTMTSYSSVTRDYSLPSSFAGDEGNRSSGEVCAEHKLSMTSLISSTNRSQTGQQKQQQQKQQEEEMSQLMDDPNKESSTDRVGDTMEGKEIDDDDDDADSKDQLAVQISKETQPMMHLIRLLKEMDDGKGNYHAGSADPRGKALASLIHDFENEVSLIEHRVKDEYLIMNGEQPPPQEEEEDEEPLSPLPPNWIALEDPGSGDVYYANEATGQTQWERPSPSKEEGREIMSRNDRRNNVHQQGYFESSNQSDMDSSRASGMQGSNRSNDYQSGDFESSRQSHMNNSHIAGERNSNNSQHEMSEGSRQNNLNNNNSQNSNAFDNNAMRNSSTSNTFKSSKSDNTSDGNGSATMQTSFKSNEYHQYELETSKATLADGHQGGNASSIDDLPPEWTALVDPDSGETYYANEQTGETTWDKPEEQNNDSTTSPRSDDHLPADWIALEDAQSGDTYYLNQVTMATTWERPTATDESHPSSTNSGSNNPTPADQLPPGWEAIYDPSCGEYFYAHESGATQWEIPEHNQRDVNDLKSDPQDPDGNGNEKLPLGWYAAVDEDSGDTYYCNEMSGETTWDFPTAREDNEELKHPRQTKEEEEEEDVDADLPPEWYSVTDPASGDTYFCNETTGETTWDRPSLKDGKVAHELSMMSRLSMNENTVYESDSMTSSQF